MAHVASVSHRRDNQATVVALILIALGLDLRAKSKIALRVHTARAVASDLGIWAYLCLKPPNPNPQFKTPKPAGLCNV